MIVFLPYRTENKCDPRTNHQELVGHDGLLDDPVNDNPNSQQGQLFASETDEQQETSHVDNGNNCSCSDGPSQPQNLADNFVNQEITCALIKALNLVDQMKGSIADFEDILQFAKDLYCRNEIQLADLWPKDWRETQSVLRKCGYEDPKELYICLDDSHYCQWDVMEDKEALCRYCKKAGSIKYYYLGISQKIKLWCGNKDMCDKMMGHWKEKSHWMGNDDHNILLKEIWDGARFRELQWFWDADAHWMLPTKCMFCKSVVSVDEIQASPLQEDGSFLVFCKECGTEIKYSPSFANGDPRNIALIGHWDGWQPFGYPGSHSCGTVMYY